MKRFFALLLAVIMTLALVACGETEEPVTDNGNSSSEEPIIIKFGSCDAQGSFQWNYTRDLLDKIDEMAPGRFKIELYDGGSLGGERELMTSVDMGTITACQVSDGGINMVDNLPAAELGNIPFLFGSTDNMFKAWDGGLGEYIADEYYKRGFKVTDMCIFGCVEVGNSVREIAHPSDLKGLKIRVWEADGPFKFLNAVDALPTVMGYGEVYTALQQNTIDGLMTSDSNFYSEKFCEVTKYISDLSIFANYNVVVWNADWFDSLPQDLQDVITEASRITYEYYRDNVTPAARAETYANLEGEGCTITHLTEEGKAEFQAVAESIWDDFKELVGEDAFNMVYDILYK